MQPVMTNGATGHDRVIAGVLAFGLVTIAFAAIFAHRAAAPALFLMGAAVASRSEPWRVGAPKFLIRPDWRDPLVCGALALLFLIGWICLSGMWSPQGGSFRRAMIVAGPILAGGAVVWELSRRPAGTSVRRLAFVAALAGAGAILLLGAEAMTSGALRGQTPRFGAPRDPYKDMVALARGATLLTFAAPALLALVFRLLSSTVLARGRWLIVMALAVVLAAAGMRFGVQSNLVALGLALAVGVVAKARPKTAMIGVAALYIGAFLFSPIAALIPADIGQSDLAAQLPASWAQRLVIWRTAAVHAIDCLPFGCGADYARVIHAGGETVPIIGWPIEVPVMSVHPHQLFLQIWLEFGVPGVAALLAFLVFGVRAALAADLDRLERAAIVAVAGAFWVSAMLETSLWQAWRLSAIFYACALIALLRRQRR